MIQPVIENPSWTSLTGFSLYLEFYQLKAVPRQNRNPAKRKRFGQQTLKRTALCY